MAKDNNKLLKGITAVLLAGVMVGGGVAIGYGAATDWTYKKTTVTQEENKDNENGGGIVADGESNGMLLAVTAIPLNSYKEYGVSALAENAYNLNVTYTPADTTIQDTTYTIAFENPSSSWATGKTVTDYATITQSSAGSLDAVLAILQPFGERIIVTAQSDMTPEISTSVNVDYVKGITLSTTNYTHKSTSDAFDSFVLAEAIAMADTVHQSVGTVDYTSATFHCSYVMNDEIYNLLLPISQTLGISDRLHKSVECASVDGTGATAQNSTFQAFFDGGLTATERKYVMANLAKALKGRTNINLYSINLSGVDVYYNDVLTSSTSSNMAYAYQINNLNSYLTEATALTPNVTDLIFSDNGLV